MKAQHEKRLRDNLKKTGAERELDEQFVTALYRDEEPGKRTGRAAA